MNRGKQLNNKSGYKGVTKVTKGSKWQAVIREDRKNTYLGCFDTKEEAARAYDAEARKRWGDRAGTNFED